MSARRGATTLSGILLVDKPAGMPSHDVVAAIRRATREGRVGHAGTLDPMATGLLVVLVGPCTRLEPYLSDSVKTYEARIAFGSETDTDDADGSVVHVAPVPDDLFDAHRAQTVLDALIGESMQTPPAYSAIKVSGRTAYRSARSGEAIALEPRPVEVKVADLVALDGRSRTWDVLFRVSKGTYIRALARDVGRSQGSAAHLASLRRTDAGLLHLEDANALEDVVDAAIEGKLPDLFADPVHALGLPAVAGDPEALAVGGPMRNDTGAPAGARLAVTFDGRLAAVYRVEADTLVAEVVLPGGAS